MGGYIGYVFAPFLEELKTITHYISQKWTLLRWQMYKGKWESSIYTTNVEYRRPSTKKCRISKNTSNWESQDSPGKHPWKWRKSYYGLLNIQFTKKNHTTDILQNYKIAYIIFRHWYTNGCLTYVKISSNEKRVWYCFVIYRN